MTAPSHPGPEPGAAATLPTPTAPPQRRSHVFRWLILLGLVALAAWWYGTGMYKEYGLASMAQKGGWFREYARENQLTAMAILFGLTVLCVGLSIPTLALGSLLAGYLFDFWVGLAVMSPALTLGATVAFVGSRYLFYDYLRRLSARYPRFRRWMDALDRGTEHSPRVSLMILRLSPSIPFGVVNFGMALTRMKLAPFVWVSWLGMLPVTATFVLIGTQASHIRRPRELFMGREGRVLIVLLVFLTVARIAIWAANRRRTRRAVDARVEIEQPQPTAR